MLFCINDIYRNTFDCAEGVIKKITCSVGNLTHGQLQERDNNIVDVEELRAQAHDLHARITNTKLTQY